MSALGQKRTYALQNGMLRRTECLLWANSGHRAQSYLFRNTMVLAHGPTSKPNRTWVESAP
jgi:hypothetical protein